MKNFTRYVFVMVLCAGIMMVVLPMCMDESQSERWAESSPIERPPVVIFAVMFGVAVAVLQFMFRVGFTRASLVMMLCAGMIVLGMIGLTYTAIQDRPVTQMGAEVQTTDKYEHLFNDSFAGHVVQGPGVLERAVTVRSPEGVERRIAIKWLEAGGD